VKQDIHDEARQLIALGGDLPDTQQLWLRRHLDECESCRNYQDCANQIVRALHASPLAADSRLVRATQMRVRFHASRLQEHRQRMWMVGIACLGVGLSATLTAPLLWKLFAWLGAWAGVTAAVWESAFILFGVAPALVVSVLLLARGIAVSSGGHARNWK
jgi:predicted anti-sigma-YlaC factor YlaD